VIVLDASAAVLALVSDGDSRHLLAATDGIAVPHLADVEVASTLWAHVRRGEVTAAQGRRLLATWARLGVERSGVTGLLDRIWELRGNLTAYDATYVALAEALTCPLVTADRRLAGAPGPTCQITVVRS